MKQKKSELLAIRFKEVLLDGTWIANTNWQKELSDVGIIEANKKVANLNTIGALTFHINYYIAGLNEFFENGKLEIKDEFSFDAPALIIESDWINLKQKLIENSQSLIQHILALTEDELESIFIKKEYGSYLRNIDGAIEHAYYHLGQVSLLKKLI